jgi:hypothetical protein
VHQKEDEGIMAKKAGEGKQTRLLDRFLQKKAEFKPYKFDMAVELHERLDKLKKDAGLTNEAVNDALNYAVRTLLTRLEREAKQGKS